MDYIGYGVDYVTTVMQNLIVWFHKLLTTLDGMEELLLALFFLYMVIRLIIAPYLDLTLLPGSDVASKRLSDKASRDKMDGANPHQKRIEG